MKPNLIRIDKCTLKSRHDLNLSVCLLKLQQLKAVQICENEYANLGDGQF